MQKRRKNTNENTKNENENDNRIENEITCENENSTTYRKLAFRFFRSSKSILFSPCSSNRTKPPPPDAKFTLLPDFKLCCTFTSLCTMNIKEMSLPSRRTVDDELADYVSGLSVKPNDVSVAALIDPQHFWLQNISKYPTLGHLALDLISAPASEAYSERVFSYCALLTTG